MLANPIVIEQASNRKISLKIEGRITMPMIIPSDFLKTVKQQRGQHIDFILRLSQKIELFESKTSVDEIFLKQYHMYLQEFVKKYDLIKSDPTTDELLKESEASLNRVWNTGYDDDWD